MARLKGWQAALVRKLAAGDLVAMPQGRDPQRVVNDAIAYLRGTPRDDGESFLVVASFVRDRRAWRYRLTYGGSIYNIMVDHFEELK